MWNLVWIKVIYDEIKFKYNKDNVKVFGDDRGKLYWIWIECV